MTEIKEKVQYSKYQIPIFETIMTTNLNIVVNATAGSGKTFTAVEISKLIPASQKTIFLAFNKSIVEELQTKLSPNIKCTTIHSLGMNILMEFYKTHLRVNEFKIFMFCEKHVSHLQKKEKFVKMFLYREIIDKIRLTMCSLDEVSIMKLVMYYDISGIENSDPPKIIEIFKDMEMYNYFLGSENNVIDYTDMIYLPVTQTRLKLPQYDFTIIDELQDLNKCQQEFVKKLIGTKGRFIGLGDDFQCQPEGTKILMSDLSEKNIEDLQIGDYVIGYDMKWGGGFKGVKTNPRGHNSDYKRPQILNIEKRKYEGELIVIKAGGKISKYTPEHICFVRFNDDPVYKKAQALYLMEKDGYYRIGITPYQSKAAHNPALTSRAKQEKANNFWILDIFETKREAYLSEQYYSYTYSIPQLRFFDNQTGVFNQRELDELWSRFDKEKMKKDAINLLKVFKRDIQYPLWERKKHNYFSKTHIRPIVACNIIPKYMQIPLFNFEKKTQRQRHTHYFSDCQDIELSYEKYDKVVYSLEVSKYNNYVADGILTHNCIYSFLGADSGSFQSFVELPNTIQLPLSVSYRCAKEIVLKAREICDTIEPFEGSPQGEVRKGTFDEIVEGDFVLCRNNRPLIFAYLQLIKRGLKCTIKGKDIEAGLLEFILKFKNKSTEAGLQALKDKLTAKAVELKEKRGISKPENNPAYLLMKEKLLTIETIVESQEFAMMDQVIKFIEEVFDEEKGDGVQLMTIHKSKGLEARRVFYIEKFEGKKLIPSTHATQPWELKQEQNLLFVVITRAKEQLIYLNL